MAGEHAHRESARYPLLPATEGSRWKDALAVLYLIALAAGIVLLVMRGPSAEPARPVIPATKR